MVDYCKLDNDQRMEVLRMHAEGLSSSQIQKEVLSAHDIAISRKALLSTCRAKKNLPFVQEFRLSYLSKIKDVPIANKRVRIDDLEKVRKKLLGIIESLPTKTKTARAELAMIVKRLNETLAVAREEMEKKPSLVAGVVIGDLSGQSDDDLKDRKERLVAKALDSIRGGTTRFNAAPEGDGVTDFE